MLLHHVMGELEGIRNAWGYVEGGNGALSEAIARAARSHGAVLCTDAVSTQLFQLSAHSDSQTLFSLCLAF